MPQAELTFPCLKDLVHYLTFSMIRVSVFLTTVAVSFLGHIYSTKDKFINTDLEKGLLPKITYLNILVILSVGMTKKYEYILPLF